MHRNSTSRQIIVHLIFIFCPKTKHYGIILGPSFSNYTIVKTNFFSRSQPTNKLIADNYFLSFFFSVKRQPRPKKNLSELLLSKLATIDSKDIRQHIDVKHHHEDIYGDLNLVHADGSRAGQFGTSNFDSVAENVDLMLKNGKAFITVTVTAERITPIDIEFNVWRKNQAIVTRVIEIDLFANEQRRRLYETVMERAQTQETGNGGYTYVNPRETVLSSEETLDLFTEIMDAADGEGDKEDITVRKSQRKTRVPGNNLDFLY